MTFKLNNNVTYYLGAGASYNAMPVVDQMPAGLFFLRKYLTRADFAAVRLEANEIIKDATWLINEHKKYYSVDTAAKVYYHQEGRESENLRRLKKIVTFYFIVEQSEVIQEDFNNAKKALLDSDSWKGVFDYDKLEKAGKLEAVDRRYFRLLAYFLGSNDVPTLPSNLNFITWNYDRQLEQAFAHFMPKRGTAPFRLEGVPGLASDVHHNRPEGLKEVCHLNGKAGVIQEKYKISDMGLQYQDESLIECRNGLVSMYGNLSEGNLLKFAWEENEYTSKVLNLAKEILRKTNVLVVVGYSFPNFNRTVDTELLNAFKEGGGVGIEKKVVFQDPNKARAEAMQKVFGLDYVEPFLETDEFFIPPGV